MFDQTYYKAYENSNLFSECQCKSIYMQILYLYNSLVLDTTWRDMWSRGKLTKGTWGCSFSQLGRPLEFIFNIGYFPGKPQAWRLQLLIFDCTYDYII